mgnify:CR=1 FL=1|jgi:hypothetical protein
MSSKESAINEEKAKLLETVHTSKVVLEAAKDLIEVEEKAKEELSKTMEEIKGEVQEAHEDAADELASLKEDVKEKVEKHSGIVALALYLCGCVSMLWKQKESNKCANEKCECECGDKIEPKDVEEKIENKK